jgi:AGZA family xanthine/uracil permease-like MFS transporter
MGPGGDLPVLSFRNPEHGEVVALAEAVRAVPGEVGWLERTFQLRERGTTVGNEVRAGLATFMVMAYIIFVNPSILGAVADPTGAKLPFPAVLTVTCLTAGVLSILMGLASNYPFALAPGMGLNG